VEDLHFDHGTWRLVFPTVVGPRYIPGNTVGRSGSGWSPDTDQVPDASRITPPVLAPGERSGHDISIAVSLDPGFAISDLASPSHDVLVARPGRGRATVELAPRDTIPNKDFILTWTTGGAAVESTVVAHRTADDGFLTLILQPPAQPTADQVVPREIVFVLDTSGSMSGEPIAACKQLVRRALGRLRPDDTFRLIRFAGQADQLDVAALPVNQTNVERALSYLDGMRGGGGTEMLAGVRAALDAPRDPYRLRMVLFLTDGFIGNEEAIIRGVSEKLGDARIFSLGVGSSVNRYLLDRLAVAGRGVAEYLRPGESPDALVQRFYDHITDPVFTELELDWGGLEVVDVEPQRLPDLFAAQPLLVHARYRSGGVGTVHLRGWGGTERIEVATRVRLPEREPANAAQARLWARARIVRLELDKAVATDQAPFVNEITELALAHRLMTAYTSFVAVDHSQVRDDGELVTVDQPLPMPEGVSYEGVFGDSGQRVGRSSGFAVRQKMLRAPAASPAPRTTEADQIWGSAAPELEPAPPAQVVLGLPEAPPPLEPGGVARFVVGGSITEPIKIAGPAPAYPEAARRASVQGTVILELTIDATGAVTTVKPLRRLPLGLTESATTAVRQWRFQPANLHGRAIPVMYIMTVAFHLDGGPAVAAASAIPVPGAVAATAGTAPDPVRVAPPAPVAAVALGTTDAAEQSVTDSGSTTAPQEGLVPPPRQSLATTTSRRGFELAPVSIAVGAVSLVLLLIATGAWLVQRRAAIC